MLPGKFASAKSPLDAGMAFSPRTKIDKGRASCRHLGPAGAGMTKIESSVRAVGPYHWRHQTATRRSPALRWVASAMRTTICVTAHFRAKLLPWPNGLRVIEAMAGFERPPYLRSPVRGANGAFTQSPRPDGKANGKQCHSNEGKRPGRIDWRGRPSLEIREGGRAPTAMTVSGRPGQHAHQETGRQFSKNPPAIPQHRSLQRSDIDLPVLELPVRGGHAG